MDRPRYNRTPRSRWTCTLDSFVGPIGRGARTPFPAREVIRSVSALDRLAAALERRSGRQTLFAVAVMNAITGVGLGLANAAREFGQDAALFRRCALLLVDGQTDFCGSLYSPLTALVGRPLTWVSPTTAFVGMSLIGIAVLITGVILDTRGRAPVDRVMVAIAALTFAPVVYELLLGQTTLLIAAAVYPVARRADAFRNGIPLGFALALAPKPLLVPVLVWMIVWRRRSLTAALLTGALLTGIGIAVLGIDQYRAWLAVLMGAGLESVAGSFWLSLRDLGNYSLWPLDPAKLALAGVCGVATIWTILRDAQRGFVAALLAGLLLAPYSLLYAFSILLLAVKPALAFAPRVTRVLALTAYLAGVPFAAFTAWSLAGLAATVPTGRGWNSQNPSIYSAG